jgi:hypothetical protein
LGSVLIAALGNSNVRGAPGAGISGASFTPGGTIPEAFWGSCDEAGSVSLRDTGGADACGFASAVGANAAVATTEKATAIRKIDPLIARFIIAPENIFRIGVAGIIVARALQALLAPPA